MSGIVNAAGSRSGIIGQTELDYEEGTWTIAFAAASGTITVNSTYDTASYTKIGRTVHSGAWTTISSVSSPSGELTMSGIPYVVSQAPEDSDYSCGSVTYLQSWNAFSTNHVMNIWTGPTYNYLRMKSYSGTSGEAIADHVASGAALLFSITYITDS